MVKTEIIKIDVNNIDMDKLKYASDILRNGGLVAFPTETVYGLGANALNEKAIGKIYEAKGRPADNPIIVHIADKKDVGAVSRNSIDEDAEKLMEEFWPGPLTIVLKKADRIPSIITAGLDTVAVRMPAHPVALALIKEAGVPVGAPSANSSGKPSPTRAEHVINDLYGKVDIIIDAGESIVGLESTVLDITVHPPMILRPGGVTPAQISKIIREVDIDWAIMEKDNDNKEYIPKSPGVKYKHYSPEATVIVVSGRLSDVTGKIVELSKEYVSKGYKVGIMATEQTKRCYGNKVINASGIEVISLGDRDKPETIASSLFWILREFDKRNVQIVLAESIDNTGIGLAIMNRLNKAAGFNIINV
jgi:L-threonylcarbamoyladenylate synthase